MSNVKVEITEINKRKIAFLYLDNAQTKNSMTWEMGLAFRSEIEKLKISKDVSCLIITGKNHIFSSGGDLGLLASFKSKTFEENKRDMFVFYNNFLSVRTLPFPVIAAVNGHAMGAALSLAFACDIRVFSQNSKYSFNFVKLGIHPGMGSSYITSELFGKDKSNYLLMLADSMTGEEAHEQGFCHDAVAMDDVLKRAMEFAITVGESSPIALRLLKQTVYDNEALEKALMREADAQAQCFRTADFAESITAITEKRKPFFKGE